MDSGEARLDLKQYTIRDCARVSWHPQGENGMYLTVLKNDGTVVEMLFVVEAPTGLAGMIPEGCA